MDNLFVGNFSIGQTLDRAIRLYKLTVQKVLILFSVPCLLSLANVKTILTPDLEHPFAFLNGFYILMVILGCWSLILAVRYVDRTGTGETMGFGEIIKLVRPVDLLMIVSFILWYAAMVLGLLLLIIPGIYLMNISMIGMLVIIIEKKYFFNSIGRSFKLTRGRWWKTFVINVISCLIVVIPSWLGLMLFMAPTFMRSLSSSPPSAASGNPAPEITAMTFVGYGIYMAISVLAYALLITINVVHYNSLRSEKDHSPISPQPDASQTASAGGG